MSRPPAFEGLRVIDCHSHFLSSALLEALERRQEAPRVYDSGGQRMIQYGDGMVRRIAPTMADFDAKLVKMEEDGIDAMVVSTSVPGVDWFSKEDGPVVAAAINDELCQLVRDNPGRVAAMAALPIQSGEAAAAELERGVGMGMAGGVLFSNLAGRTIDEPEFQQIFATAEKLDVPIMIHPTYPLCIKTFDAYSMQSMLGYLVDTTAAVLRLVLGGLYERHPKTKIYLTHAGSLLPYMIGRIDNGAGKFSDEKPLEAKPSVYIKKLYTDTICNNAPTLRMAHEFFNDGRLMFGTDAPFWDPAINFATVDELGLDDAERKDLVAGNAATLFGL
jgi:aminocarboxymuconate-semialdehyde decarboxylase